MKPDYLNIFRLRIFILLACSLQLAARGVADSKETAQQEADERNEKAEQLCMALPGYNEFQREFRLHDAMLGSINFPPESLYVRIDAKTPQVIDAAWWWDPLDANKRPTLGWNDLRTAYLRASEVVSKHRWLLDWKRGLAGRSIELWI